MSITNWYIHIHPYKYYPYTFIINGVSIAANGSSRCAGLRWTPGESAVLRFRMARARDDPLAREQTKMTSEELAKRIAPAKHLLGYFDQQALASYRNEPEKFVIETDSFEGRLTVTNSYYEELEEAGRTDEYLDFKFGYRALADGELAVVLWLPDLKKATKHQSKWIGFILNDPVWTDTVMIGS